MDLTGIHHLTAVSADISGNYRFYTGVMGMRLVKRSVNQDDVRAYHLFYADAKGSPGTDLTFFDWAVPPEQRGSHSITLTSLRVNGHEALEWWARHLDDAGVTHGPITDRDGRAVLDFEDPEGQRLSLVDDGGAGDEPVAWKASPVPEPWQIRGLGPIHMSVPVLQPTALVLTDVLNMKAAREYAGTDGQSRIVVFEMGGGGPTAELHVHVDPRLPPVRPGAGGVHHVAFRTPDETQYHAWAERLNELGMPNSGEIDRYYFRSLYMREPNGVLFEIATDGPGFAVDEDPATLGEAVVLPPFLEPRRAEIIRNLKPIES
jgi:glyoxalase family protein